VTAPAPTTPARPARAAWSSTPLRVATSRAVVRRRRRDRLRHPRTPRRGVRLRPRPVADPAPRGRRPRRTPLVLHLLRHRRRAQHRRPGSPRRAVLLLAGPRGPPRRRDRRDCPRSAPSPRTSTAAGHHVLIAAGSGITPMLSIAGSHLAADTRSRVTLFYGNRRSGTVMFADELADLKDLYPARFQLAHILSREPREAETPLRPHRRRPTRRTRGRPGRRGRRRPLVALRPARHGPATHKQSSPASASPPTASTGSCSSPTTSPSTPEPSRRPPTTARSARSPSPSTAAPPTPRSRRDTSILDGAQKTRPDLPFACKGGVCGTCRALVTEGDRRHAPQLRPRTRRGRRKGYVLTCQTFPVSDTLTVDYDS
jgi:ring-1,2-phenylacetyl-CoA epoxidase subunit PaaE